MDACYAAAWGTFGDCLPAQYILPRLDRDIRLNAEMSLDRHEQLWWNKVFGDWTARRIRFVRIYA